MDDSFKVRVDKVFGSLTASASSTSSLRSLWSLSDEEVEKKEWNRDRGEDIDREGNPCSSSFDGFFSNQRKISQKNDEEEDERPAPGQAFGQQDDEEEEWDIRSSIGLDCTLDNEEEEDEHDKVAVGRENADERLYMKDITDYGTYLNCHNILPESYKDHARDSRANHSAARTRLKEDEMTPGGVNSSPDAGNKMPAIVDLLQTDDGGHLKSILKRREDQADNKSQKRVRFDPVCKKEGVEELEGVQDTLMDNCSLVTNIVAADTCPIPQSSRGVPDYLQNPSKYMRYSFDSLDEVDENSNRQACMDLFNTIRSSRTEDSQLEHQSADFSKSVTFIPKKKTAMDTTTVEDISHMKHIQLHPSKESIGRAGIAPGIAAAEVQEHEVCAMEEDHPETSAENRSSSQKTGRQYRSKVRPDEPVR